MSENTHITAIDISLNGAVKASSAQDWIRGHLRSPNWLSRYPVKFRDGFALPLLEFRDQVHKDTIIVKAQIGQIVGEVGEVIADTDFGIVSDMTIERGQNAGALVICPERDRKHQKPISGPPYFFTG